VWACVPLYLQGAFKQFRVPLFEFQNFPFLHVGTEKTARLWWYTQACAGNRGFTPLAAPTPLNQWIPVQVSTVVRCCSLPVRLASVISNELCELLATGPRVYRRLPVFNVFILWVALEFQ